MTKELLLNNEIEELLPDVKDAFEKYINSCINYYKVKDKMDFIQEDYKDLNDNDLAFIEETSENEFFNKEENNKLLMRSICTNKYSLDKFVTIKRLEPVRSEVIPLQKEINLLDPIYRNKGICKKNNIYNSYKDNEKNEI